MLNGVIALLGLSGPQRQQVGTGQALGAALGAGIGGFHKRLVWHELTYAALPYPIVPLDELHHPCLLFPMRAE